MWQWRINDCEGGLPLTEALRRRIPAAPAGYLHQLLRKGRVTLDGVPAVADLPVGAGMTVTVTAGRRCAELVAASAIAPEELLYEDDSTVVLFKPAGLATHPHPGQADSLTERAARFMALRRAPYRLAPVHRLDRGTSGPLLFAKGRPAAGHFGRLLMDRRLSRHYLALVSGVPPTAGELASAVDDGGVARASLTRFRSLATAPPLSLVALDPATGRRHQLRQQLAAAGWPIVGDRRYGGPPWPGLDHPFLHCRRLTFPRLADGRPQTVEVPLPAPLRAILAACGIDPAAAAAELP